MTIRRVVPANGSGWQLDLWTDVVLAAIAHPGVKIHIAMAAADAVLEGVFTRFAFEPVPQRATGTAAK